MPRVSVVIPTYNRVGLIQETLDSVLAQTYRDFEIIVVDDGSTDETPQILTKYDQRIRVIRQENQGQGPARNTGILAAQGEYIAFVDSDDVWVPTKLECQINLFAYEQLAWAYSDAYAFDGETEQMLYLFSQRSCQCEGGIAHQLLVSNFIATSTVMVRRQIFEDVGLFSRMPKAQDWDLWLRIATRHPIRKTAKALTGYRIHKGMITQAQTPMRLHRYHIATIERAVAFASEVYGPVRRQALAIQHLKTGNGLAAQGHLPEARKMFWRAICLRPAMLSVYPRLLSTLLGKKFVMSWIQRNRKRLGIRTQAGGQSE